MKHEMQTKRNLAVLLTGMVLLAWGLAPIASAVKPVKPSPDPPADARYNLVGIGVPLSLNGLGVNKWSQVIGNTYNNAFLVTPADVDGDGVPDTWFTDADLDGTNDLMIDLGSLGGDGSFAFGINDHGQVVGSAQTADPAPGYAFIIVPQDWTGPGDEPDGVPDTWFADDGNEGNALMISLGTPSPGGLGSEAYDISNSGYVVGGVGGPIPEERGAFIVAPEDNTGPGGLPDGVPDTWFRDDGSGHNALMTIVMSSPTLRVPLATDVNDSGQVIGYSSETNGDLDDRAFLVTPADVDGDGDLDWFSDANQDGINDLMIELEPSPGDTGCRAHAINSVSDSGVVQVVGQSWSFNGRVSSGYHGVRWEVDELGTVTLTDLGSIYPNDINDVGQVVGSHKWGSRKNRHRSALLWENGTLTSLVDMLSNSDGISDASASGINVYGDIVGSVSGTGYQGPYIAVANPPTQ